MTFSTKIEDLEDNFDTKNGNRDLDNLDDIVSVSDTKSDIDIDIDNGDINAILETSFMKKIIKSGIDSIIVFILILLFTNPYIISHIFSIEMLSNYMNTTIGSSIVASIIAFFYFLIKYFTKF